MATLLGELMPLGDEHAVSVYLPRWQDYVSWASREPSFASKLKSGYPRFFVAIPLARLVTKLLEWFRTCADTPSGDEKLRQALKAPGLLARVFPSYDLARTCSEYLKKSKPDINPQHIAVVRISFNGEVKVLQGDGDEACNVSALQMPPDQKLYAVTFPDLSDKDADIFWQHTGYGISSRFAQYWTTNAPFLNATPNVTHQFARLPTEEAEHAKTAIRKRIAMLASSATKPVDTRDVFLYPMGMHAISQAGLIIRSLHEDAKEPYRVAFFGFLYVDTPKSLKKIYGFECELYGHATSADIDRLEADLEAGSPIKALYTEAPGNPLLKTPDFDRLRALSLKYGFLIIVDDTVGTPVNLDVTPFCDVVCASLTKLFSGACNVMGGSVLLSPHSPHHDKLRHAFDKHYRDWCFPTDMIVLDKNSADYEERVLVATRNTESFLDMLREHPTIEEVYYPLGSASQKQYDRLRRNGRGYGYLISLRFVKPAAAIAFFDALDVAKGPSLGTNFTLACAYVYLAHAAELEYAAEYGMDEHLVRISFGVEPRQDLREKIEVALAVAQKEC